ncbi:MAG: tRNA (adenosine(37)-N6)-threonylcarbamoyltransferase complex dimerization subunit type 1 TsaB [Ruminococcaceae bacterium]|nr:tRNA (adenosine(37)-N6)-threonylcarbamoyltransferase complex dimerization subunit type 1 TsaB [Oscillospiraceae bacterium]
MKILGVESSATSASVAVLEDGKIISLSYSNTGLTHSQTLMPMVEEALLKADVNITDVDYLAVSNGPGSFTGIRIGVSLVKGLSDPLNKKCVGVSTLEAIAKPLENTGVLAVSVMDARCNQVYCALFDCEKGEMKRLTDDEAISIDELTERLKTQEKHIVLIGDGANICYNKMKAEIENISIASPNIRCQSASSVALIAEELILNDENAAVLAEELVPKYLRLSQAERELKKKQENK